MFAERCTERAHSTILSPDVDRECAGSGSYMTETPNDSEQNPKPEPKPQPRPKKRTAGILRLSRDPELIEEGDIDSVTITEVEVPWRTIIRVVLALVMIWLFQQLWTQLVVVFIALVATLALDPLVHKLELRGLSRGRSVAAVMLSMVLAVGILIAIVAPPLVDQGANLVNTAPDYADDLSSILERYPTVNEWVDEATAEGGDANSLFERAMSFVPNLLSFGAGILSGAVSLFFLTVLTIYLLMDGPRLFESYTSRLDPEQRARFRKLRLELTRVVSGYVFGQALVSTSFGIFTFIALTIAGTPEPLLLAVLAAMLGTIPMVGATIATIPAVAMSLTVSLPTALVVLVAFVLYQQIENNFIAPRAFRNTLKISSLVVLIAVAFGSALYGVLGAMLALPIAAALPALVRGFREGVPLPPPAEELSWPSEPE
jgi:predicted PurR-regulated permease PerM